MLNRLYPSALVVSLAIVAIMPGTNSASALDPNQPVWTARFEGGASPGPALVDTVKGTAMSPDGSKVYVTGVGALSTSGGDLEISSFGTVAYDVQSGAEVWRANFGSALAANVPAAIALSPDGSKVFVTGSTRGPWSGQPPQWQTLAYDSSTGERLWLSTYSATGTLSRTIRPDSTPSDIMVSPDGTSVFVTGKSYVDETDITSVPTPTTVAYDAVTGAERWVQQLRSPTGRVNTINVRAMDLEVSPDGSKVFVVANDSRDSCAPAVIRTVAYDAVVGTLLWAAEYDHPAESLCLNEAYHVAVSPDGRQVYVAGDAGSDAGPGQVETVVLGYDALDGASLWVNLYQLSPNRAWTRPDGGIVVAPGGGQTAPTVIVSVLGDVDADPDPNAGAAMMAYGTVAYDGLTGKKLWERTYDSGPAWDGPSDVALTPDGRSVFVTGETHSPWSGDSIATVAYRVSDGAELWVRRYGVVHEDALVKEVEHLKAKAVTVAPDGGRLVITATSSIWLQDQNFGAKFAEASRDYLTLAYDIS
jgi:DNA-binding beta-propeller fold protein YncE